MNPAAKRVPVMAGIIAVLLLAALVCWASLKPRALENVKEITVSVVHSDGYIRTETYETTAPFFFDALNPLHLFGLEWRENNILLPTVDGESVEDPENEIWVYSVNGHYSELPMEEQPVEDGDKFVFYIINMAEG